MHVLIPTVGSSGDVNPFIAIGRELVSRGHRATMLVNPFFESAVTGAGLGYLPLGEEFDFRIMAQLPGATHHSRGGLVVMRELIIPQAVRIVTETERAIDSVSPDIVLAHHICFGAPWACRRRGVPYAVGVLAPSMWLSLNDPSVYRMRAPKNPPRWRIRLELWVARRVMRWMVDRPLNRARAELGMGPARDVMFNDALGGEVNLGLWSGHFRAAMPDDPARGRICGFPFHDRFGRFESAGAPTGAFLDECERAGERPVVFTMGTAVVHNAGRFYHDAAEACRRLKVRGLLVTNRPEYAPASLPPGVAAVNYAPFSALFPRAAVNVHHGGIGTTAQGLRAGRPTVIVPVAYDQFDNAARAERLGISRTLPHPRLTAGRLAAVLREALEDRAGSEKAAALGALVRAEDGAARAADELERAVQGSARAG